MRNRIRSLLIWLANKISTPEHYDFGSEVVGLQVFGENLIVATKESVFISEDGKPPYKKMKFKPTTNKEGK